MSKELHSLQFEDSVSRARRVLEMLPILKEEGLIGEEQVDQQRQMLEGVLGFIEENNLSRNGDGRF